MKNRGQKLREKLIFTGIAGVCAACLAGVGLFIGTMQVSAESTTYDYIVTDSQYGISATDKKSDSDGIQKILTLVKGATKQTTIYFPAGDYYLDKAMRVYSNTHIILDKGATIHRMDTMLGRMMLHNVDQNGNMDAVGGYNMSKNITVEGGIWDGGNIAKATEAADLIRFDHATNIVVKDCTVKNVYDCHLIEYVGVKNGSISGCTLTGFRYRKGKEKNYLYAREAIQLETAWTNNPKNKKDVSALWANGSVVDGTTCQQVSVTNNTFIDMPCGVGQHHYTSDGKYRNNGITISNNTITCSTKWKYCKTAITCGGMNNIQITNNKITGPYRFGIHITVANNVTVSGNTVKKVSQNAIMMDGGKAKKISNNTVTSPAKHGISIEGGTLTSLTGNTITKANHNGISVGKGTVKNISKNTLSTIKKNGISITGGTIGSGKKTSTGILQNTVKNCKQNGISVSKKATVSSVCKNTITGIKRNGISIVDRGVVYWIKKNTIKKCTCHGIWNGSARKKAKLKGNKGKTK